MGVKARGNGIIFDFTYRGIRRKPTLSIPPTKTNMEYAENKLAAIKYEMANGTFDFAKHFPDYKPKDGFGATQSGQTLVKDALLSYLAAKKRILAPSTYASYETAVRCHLIPSFGQLRVADLSTQAIRQWLGGLTISNKRTNNVLIPLRGTLEDAFADGAIDRNPMDRIKNLADNRVGPS